MSFIKVVQNYRMYQGNDPIHELYESNGIHILMVADPLPLHVSRIMEEDLYTLHLSPPPSINSLDTVATPFLD